MKYPPITAELLKSKDACQGQLDLFKTHFGDKPVPLNKKVFTKFSSEFDIAWAAKHLLDSTDFVEYDKVQGPALAEYENVRDPALAEYYKVRAKAWTEFEKVRDTAWGEYEKIRDPAQAEYKKAAALAFLTLYKTA